MQVIISSDRLNCLDYIKNILFSEKNVMPHSVKENKQNERYFLNISFDEKIKDTFLYRLKDLIAEVICLTYKYDFFAEKLKLEINNEELKLAFIKSLSVYDIEADKDYIFSLNLIDKVICVDGIFNFMLKGLTERWQEVVRLTNLNFHCFKSTESQILFIKYLLNTQNSKVKDVVLYSKNGKLVIADEHNKKLNYYSLLSENDRISALFSLIWIHPENILVKPNTEQSSAFNVVRTLFPEKLLQQ